MRQALTLAAWFLMAFAVVAAANGPYTTNATHTHPTIIVAVGAAGEEEFGKDFVNWAEQWRRATEQTGAAHQVIGLGPTNATTDLVRLKEILSGEPTNTTAELWLVLIGHGTFDGKEAKFNLRGPDLSATDLAEWLKPYRRPVIIINCAASSSPFLNKLSGPDRVVVTATKSGYEENFARFGKFMVEAVSDLKADLDKDGQTSLLEAFLMAARQVAEFYETEGRLDTETALLEDNGDGLGTAADFFRGARAVKKPAGGGTVDGLRAHQVHLMRSPREQQMPPEVRARRDDLEFALERLRESKITLATEDYYRRLENLLLELARLYGQTNRPAQLDFNQ